MLDEMQSPLQNLQKLAYEHAMNEGNAMMMTASEPRSVQSLQEWEGTTYSPQKRAANKEGTSQVLFSSPVRSSDQKLPIQPESATLIANIQKQEMESIDQYLDDVQLDPKSQTTILQQPPQKKTY